jgi:hypothetical protein
LVRAEQWRVTSCCGDAVRCASHDRPAFASTAKPRESKNRDPCAAVRELAEAGIVDPEPPESELERIEKYLLAEPFEPFVIEMTGGKSYRIERRDQCGFSRHGSVQLFGVDGTQWSLLSSDHIVRAQKV